MVEVAIASGAWRTSRGLGVGRATWRRVSLEQHHGHVHAVTAGGKLSNINVVRSIPRL